MSKTDSAPRLPTRATAAQKKAAATLALTPAEQKTRWKTTSTTSPRLLAALGSLEAHVTRLWPHAEKVFEYNMNGWRIHRGVDIPEWTGTIDPNWVRLYVAERKAGLSLHLWEPFGCLQDRGSALAAAGYKPMVGCMQYNRKGDLPVEPVVAVLEAVRDRMAAEA
jgi:hypothetical protein